MYAEVVILGFLYLREEANWAIKRSCCPRNLTLRRKHKDPLRSIPTRFDLSHGALKRVQDNFNSEMWVWESLPDGVHGADWPPAAGFMMWNFGDKFMKQWCHSPIQDFTLSNLLFQRDRSGIQYQFLPELNDNYKTVRRFEPWTNSFATVHLEAVISTE